MSTTVSTASELGQAIRRHEDEIVIEGRLGNAAVAIRAVGPVAWGIAIGAIGVAIAGVAMTAGTGGAGAPAGVVSEAFAIPVLVTTFGSVSTTTAAIGIAVAGGGVGVLTSMRNYNVKRKNDKVILTKR